VAVVILHAHKYEKKITRKFKSGGPSVTGIASIIKFKKVI